MHIGAKKQKKKKLISPNKNKFISLKMSRNNKGLRLKDYGWVPQELSYFFEFP